MSRLHQLRREQKTCTPGRVHCGGKNTPRDRSSLAHLHLQDLLGGGRTLVLRSSGAGRLQPLHGQPWHRRPAVEGARSNAGPRGHPRGLANAAVLLLVLLRGLLQQVRMGQRLVRLWRLLLRKGRPGNGLILAVLVPMQLLRHRMSAQVTRSARGTSTEQCSGDFEVASSHGTVQRPAPVLPLGVDARLCLQKQGYNLHVARFRCVH
mmetsp:Transcript_5004/g.14873  ORF Transcript_5004/g.14873 Transcript_5004/m.14873 type:complete len:207 (-) Transcript_5004:514-1134(-)